MLLKSVRWIWGYSEFLVSGECPEKFINSVIKNNINIWDIRKINGDVYGCVPAEDFEILRKITQDSNSQINVCKNRGLPFFMRRYGKRLGIAVGIGLFFSLMLIFSSYVWSINVTGNQKIPTQDVIKVMEELGISPGTLKKDIDASMIKQAAMIKLPNVAWLAVNIAGGRVNVSIKEKIITPDVATEEDPCNITAMCDGKVERTENYIGTPMVNVGDVVLKGQLLISGVVENSDGGNTFVSADGKVFAQTNKKIAEKIKLSQLKARDTGKTIKKYRFKFLNIEIPFDLWHKKTDDNYRCEIAEQDVVIFGWKLPVTVFKEVWYEQECGEIVLTPDEALTGLREVIVQRAEREFKDAQILQKTEQHEEENGEYRLEVVFDCIENIAKKEPVFFE